MTRNIWTNFCSPILRSLHMKFEFNWPNGFRGEDVWKCWRTTDDRRRTDNGRRSHLYTNSSPRSLPLRWAKKGTSGVRWMIKKGTLSTRWGSDSFTILGLWVLGLAVANINEPNCKFMSPKHYFKWQVCNTIASRDSLTLKLMCKRCRMRR